jgi:hypothetical protein
MEEANSDGLKCWSIVTMDSKPALEQLKEAAFSEHPV